MYYYYKTNGSLNIFHSFDGFNEIIFSNNHNLLIIWRLALVFFPSLFPANFTAAIWSRLASISNFRKVKLKASKTKNVRK